MWWLLSGKAKKLALKTFYVRWKETKACAFFAGRSVALALTVLAGALAAGVFWLHVPTYVGAQSKESDFIESKLISYEVHDWEECKDENYII